MLGHLPRALARARRVGLRALRVARRLGRLDLHLLHLRAERLHLLPGLLGLAFGRAELRPRLVGARPLLGREGERLLVLLLGLLLPAELLLLPLEASLVLLGGLRGRLELAYLRRQGAHELGRRPERSLGLDRRALHGLHLGLARGRGGRRRGRRGLLRRGGVMLLLLGLLDARRLGDRPPHAHHAHPEPPAVDAAVPGVGPGPAVRDPAVGVRRGDGGGGRRRRPVRHAEGRSGGRRLLRRRPERRGVGDVPDGRRDGGLGHARDDGRLPPSRHGLHGGSRRRGRGLHPAHAGQRGAVGDRRVGRDRAGRLGLPPDGRLARHGRLGVRRRHRRRRRRGGAPESHAPVVDVPPRRGLRLDEGLGLHRGTRGAPPEEVGVVARDLGLLLPRGRGRGDVGLVHPLDRLDGRVERRGHVLRLGYGLLQRLLLLRLALQHAEGLREPLPLAHQLVLEHSQLLAQSRDLRRQRGDLVLRLPLLVRDARRLRPERDELGLHLLVRRLELGELGGRLPRRRRGGDGGRPGLGPLQRRAGQPAGLHAGRDVARQRRLDGVGPLDGRGADHGTAGRGRGHAGLLPDQIVAVAVGEHALRRDAGRVGHGLDDGGLLDAADHRAALHPSYHSALHPSLHAALHASYHSTLHAALHTSHPALGRAVHARERRARPESAEGGVLVDVDGVVREAREGVVDGPPADAGGHGVETAHGHGARRRRAHLAHLLGGRHPRLLGGRHPHPRLAHLRRGRLLLHPHLIRPGHLPRPLLRRGGEAGRHACSPSSHPSRSVRALGRPPYLVPHPRQARRQSRRHRESLPRHAHDDVHRDPELDVVQLVVDGVVGHRPDRPEGLPVHPALGEELHGLGAVDVRLAVGVGLGVRREELLVPGQLGGGHGVGILGGQGRRRGGRRLAGGSGRRTGRGGGLRSRPLLGIKARTRAGARLGNRLGRPLRRGGGRRARGDARPSCRPSPAGPHGHDVLHAQPLEERRPPARVPLA
mmetsp:Transcript_14472/g.31759  ORF Transcript_14472/g.31759 Transcript_14472/m.31759 type:complete len:988 (+) Transcript_14472:324-3287(+)